MRISIVIPAFNEASRLPSTLVGIIDFLDRRPEWRPAEIIVVDDGSEDGTAGVVTEAPSVGGVDLRCESHPRNRGKGAAVRTGFARARGERILLCDADLSTPIAELDRLAAAGTAVAIGSRALDRSRIERSQPLYRDLMGRCFNLAVQAAAVPGLNDTQCGFKLFDGDLGRKLAAVQLIDGFAFDVELLARCRSAGLEIREVAVSWRHVDESRVQPVRHSIDMFVDLLRVGWWRLTGRLRREAAVP